MSEKDIDAVSGVETTGHSWDGIKELNNPLPRWWLWTFYATIVFSIGYMIYYPAIPLIDGATRGISGQTNRLALQQEMQEVNAARQERFDRIATGSLKEIRGDEDLYRFARAGGESLFKVHCIQCHGSGAQGSRGYPNLNDDAWIWGGDPEAIYTTIAHGVRNEQDDEARFSEMPAFGRDGILESEQINQVTAYVLSLSGQDHDAELAAEGQVVYEENCAACHGENGGGDVFVGAPNISDAVWLYGGSREQIVSQIQAPSHGVMPPWIGRLGEAGIKQLALYVHGLGGGQ